MKILVAIAAFGLLAQSSFALTLNDLAGKWVGVRIAKQNGQTQNQPTTFVFKKAKGGLSEHRTTKLASGTIQSSGKYTPDDNGDGTLNTNAGLADFFSTMNGKVISVSSGDWSFERNTFRLYLTSESDDSNSSTTIRLLNHRSFILVIRFSSGASATGRFVRQ
jgi:hypothetical protein